MYLNIILTRNIFINIININYYSIKFVYYYLFTFRKKLNEMYRLFQLNSYLNIVIALF